MKRTLPVAALLILLAVALLRAPTAPAILNDTGNGNTTAPPDDPGWALVAKVGGLNGIYLGYGWMLTASHVSPLPASVDFWPIDYPVVPNSRVVIKHDDDVTNTEIALFQIAPYPGFLPTVPIATSAPSKDTPVTLIGQGWDQGAFTTWGNDGWEWATTFSKRWGTNVIGGDLGGPGPPITSRTEVTTGNRVTWSLVADFTKNENPSVSPHECHVTERDSGGALFVDDGGWKLAGLNFARTVFSGQPADTAIYGNDLFSADLAHYRAKILAIARPCQDGVDNDGDTVTDLADPGCLWEGDRSELYACQDGIDNDWDGQADYPNDPDCTAANDPFEGQDQDGDYVIDEIDNCLTTANPGLRDTDRDGYGNACDADYGNDGVVGGPDLIQMNVAYGSTEGDPDFDEDIDSTGDGVIGGPEVILMSNSFGKAPGPSGLSCAGTVPCP